MIIGVGEIISRSVKLYRDNTKLFLKYVLIILIPSILVGFTNVLLGSLTFSEFPIMGSINWMYVPVYAICAITLSVISFWISIAFVRVVAKRYQNASVEPTMVELKTASKLILPVAWVSILTGLAVFGGILLVVIPGIIFAIWFSFSYYGASIDGKHGTEAMKYSKHLVQGRWWGTFWRIAAPNVVFSFLYGIIQSILGLIIRALPLSVDVNAIILASISAVISILVIPLTTSALTILYIEMKNNPVTMDIPVTAEPPKA